MVIDDRRRITETQPSASPMSRQRDGRKPARQAKRSPYSVVHDADGVGIYLNAFSLLVHSCRSDRHPAVAVTR